jgi:dTDP-4-amino-4,6-dideoxygalactose transaminase
VIPFIDLRPQNETLRGELEAALRRVLDSGAFTLGPEVLAFEQEFASWCGVPHAVAVNSGTAAIHLALLAAGIGPGDDVLTTPFTFVATACAIRYVGANPVFADIEPLTRNLDPEAAAKALTPRTRAILPVHLYGQTADMDPLRALAERHDAVLIEDAAQAHGATYRGVAAGGLGTLGCFSFYPTKNLGALGEGGLVTTRDAKLADTLRLLREWGSREKYQHDFVAYNARMDAFQGAALRVKLRRLTAWNEERRAIAARYAELLPGVGLEAPLEAPGRRHVWHVYAVRVPEREHAGLVPERVHAGLVPERERVAAALREQGVGTAVVYPRPLHLQPAFADLGLGAGSFPNAERAARELLGLPMYPGLPQDGPERVVAALAKALGR